MTDLVSLVQRHGTGFVFANVLVEQLGLPVPALPTLVVAGALAADGRLPFGKLLLAAFLATVLADTLWFLLGRRYGQRVLKTLCKRLPLARHLRPPDRGSLREVRARLPSRREVRSGVLDRRAAPRGRRGNALPALSPLHVGRDAPLGRIGAPPRRRLPRRGRARPRRSSGASEAGPSSSSRAGSSSTSS